MPDSEINSSIEAKGPDLSIALYGGILDYDGAGHYPGLELLNLVFGVVGTTMLPSGETVKIKRKSLDFARKLVWDDDFDTHPDRREVLLDRSSEVALSHLLECLQLEIPSSNKRPGWERAHFFPYTRSLLHFDARRSKGTKETDHRVSIERRYFRGGGALAFKVLRMDPDSKRLALCREGFDRLYGGTTSSPLDRLAETLAMQSKRDDEPVEDQVEARSQVRNDELDELFRDGVVSILMHVELSTVVRIRSLVNWTAIWLIIMQMVRSSRYLDPNAVITPIVIDSGAGHAQLRRASQRCLKDNQALIVDAVEKSRVVEFGDASLLSKKQRDKIKGFFWATAATARLLNSWRGRRHFTLGLDALETLVLAGVAKDTQMTFGDFSHKWLYEKCHMVVGRTSAHDAGLLSSFDASIFEDNEAKLVEQMSAAGLLTEYSDATRMVGLEI
jgi:hypothetical protein